MEKIKLSEGQRKAIENFDSEIASLEKKLSDAVLLYMNAEASYREAARALSAHRVRQEEMFKLVASSVGVTSGRVSYDRNEGVIGVEK